MSDNTDQPSGVTTQERPRPPDESVVTSDIDLSAGAESPPKKPAEQQRDSKSKAPAAATDDKSARSNGQESATDDDKDDPPPKRRNQPAEYRIKKMTRKLADSERSREALERRLAEQEQRLASLEQQGTRGGNDDDPPPEPQLEDFKNPRQYAKAYAKWEKQSEQQSKSSRSNAPSRTAPRQDDPPPREPRPDVDREIREFQDRGQTQYGDEFMEALQAKIPVSQDMGEYMLDSEHGPSLYIHLANNPDEARRISDSSPRRAAKLLDELDARAAKGELDVPEGELQVEGDDDNDKDDDKDDTGADKSTSTPKGKTAGEKEPPRRGRQKTRAPAPPDQNSDRGTPVTDTDLEALDMEDYAAVRREQMKNQRF